MNRIIGHSFELKNWNWEFGASLDISCWKFSIHVSRTPKSVRSKDKDFKLDAV